MGINKNFSASGEAGGDETAQEDKEQTDCGPGDSHGDVDGDGGDGDADGDIGFGDDGDGAERDDDIGDGNGAGDDEMIDMIKMMEMMQKGVKLNQTSYGT